MALPQPLRLLPLVGWCSHHLTEPFTLGYIIGNVALNLSHVCWGDYMARVFHLCGGQCCYLAWGHDYLWMCCFAAYLSAYRCFAYQYRNPEYFGRLKSLLGCQPNTGTAFVRPALSIRPGQSKYFTAFRCEPVRESCF